MDYHEWEPPPRARGKVRRPRETPWNPHVLRTVTRAVLQKKGDVVIPPLLAKSVSVPVHEVGACILKLVADGILLSRRPIHPYDADGELVVVHTGTRYDDAATWNGRQWVYSEINYNHRRRRGARYSKKLVTEIPVTDWDGTGYYLVRGPEYEAAREEFGLNEKPWECQKCLRKVPSGDDTCRCGFVRELAKPKAKPVCPRCGSEVPYKSLHGKRRADHPLRKCNLALVKHILEV